MSKHPTKEDARNLAEKYGKDGIIIFHFNWSQFGYVSYGKTKELCAAIKTVADKLYRVITKYVEKK